MNQALLPVGVLLNYFILFAHIAVLAEDRRITLNTRVDEIAVSYDSNEGHYDIDISPYNCASDLQMIQVYNAPVASGGTGRLCS